LSSPEIVIQSYYTPRVSARLVPCVVRCAQEERDGEEVKSEKSQNLGSRAIVALGRKSPPFKSFDFTPNTGRSGVQALSAAAGGGPGGEGFQLAAVFPGEMKEFAGVEVASFFAKEGFKAPLDVRAFPGLKAIAAGSEPVELEKIPHGQKVISFKLSVSKERLSFGFAVTVS
jgi:hypothetical protein